MIRLITGESSSALQLLDKESIDLTVTSPPYDNLRTYNGGLGWGEHVWKPVIRELCRVTKHGGVVVWVVGDATINGAETGTSFKQAIYFKDVGFNLHDTMIYKKKGMAYPDKNRYYQCFEYMFVFSRGKPKTINLLRDKRNKYAGSSVTGNSRLADGRITPMTGKHKRTIKEHGVRWNVWEYSTGWGHSYTEPYLKHHPAIFPQALAEDHILSWSNEHDTVLDPFMGSGTTGKMAVLSNRHFIGIEVNKEYSEMAERRIRDAKQSLFMRGGKEVKAA
jgi:DNA modification methylase